MTKYDHAMGPIANFICHEAGYPVPDKNSFEGTDGPTGTNVNDVAVALVEG